MDRKKLTNYYQNKKYLLSKIYSYQERRDAIARLAASYEGEKVFNSRKIQDQEAEKLVKLLDDLYDEIDKLIEQGNKEQKEILFLLDKLSQPVYKTILSMKYLENKDLPIIADELHYSYIHVCRLHGNALAEWDELC